MPGDINFKWPLRKYSRGFPDSHRSFQGAIKEDIKILILTKQGERLMHPDMGTKIISSGGLLFENMTNIFEMREQMYEEVKETVGRYLPAVTITNLTLEDVSTNSLLNNNELLITILYVVTGTNGFSDRVSFRISE